MDKQWYEERIFGYECRAVEIINEGLPKRETLKKLRKELLKLNKIIDSTEYHALWNFSLSLYKKLRKDTPLRDTYRAMTHAKNQIADHVEFRIKHDAAMNLVNSGIAFYQLDSHPNCADGHRAYEGGIFLNSDAASPEEKEFAATHGIKTVREVMFSEPWLCTRRNCRHRLLPVPTGMVMNNAVPNPPVIREHDPRTPAYRAYYDRKKFLQAEGISKENDTYKRTVELIRKHKLS